MRILFCNNLLEGRKVDPDFQNEWLAARDAGFDISLISYEALIAGNLSECLSQVKASDQEQVALYRGWMLTVQQYSTLYSSLLKLGFRLINSPEAYAHCHYLPESFSKVDVKSPKTVWLPISEPVKDEEIRSLLAHFGNTAVVVKDYVKSEKHYWKEACFIPDAGNWEQAQSVIRRFIELRGKELNVGLVLRQFEQLKFLANHSVSGMPLTIEFRLFFLYGKLIALYPYWTEGDYAGHIPDTKGFENLARDVESSFFTMDIALKDSGEWIVMELGDGQVSGLPSTTFNNSFFTALNK